MIRLHDKLPPDVRAAAQTLLLSRKGWTRALLEAVSAGTVDRRGIPLDAVRRMTVHRDEAIDRLVGKHWGKLQGATTAQGRTAGQAN